MRAHGPDPQSCAGIQNPGQLLGDSPPQKGGIACIKKKDDAYAMCKGKHFTGAPAAEAPSIDAKEGCIGGRGVGVLADMQLRSAARGARAAISVLTCKWGECGFGCGS
jgi:hypothetical protein